MDRVEDPGQLNLVAGVLIAVLGDVCARERIAANLAASNNDIRSLVRAALNREPLPDDIPLTHGWRSAHLLPKLTAVLEGKVLVRVADVRAEAPLDYREVKETPVGDE
jgi:hypothetical protein